jgi:SAM-dependent methyltransferase
MDADKIRQYNRQAWNVAVARKSEWTIPVSIEQIEAARRGVWQIRLTPTKPAPASWFPADLSETAVLCLASGGGQQGPILAAAGATVTVLDNAPSQLAQDRKVARREGLAIQIIEGDIADLSMLADGSYDLVVNPTSNLFVPDVRPVWREAFRVLRKGGVLMAGFMNPAVYIFDQRLADQGVLQVRHKLPYSDLTSLDPEERKKYEDDWQPYEFGHTWEDQIGGQLEAGFVITGFYEDTWPGTALSDYMPTFAVTRATKPDC